MVRANLRFSRAHTAAMLQVIEACAPEKAPQIREELEVAKRGVEQQVYRVWGPLDENEISLDDQEPQ